MSGKKKVLLEMRPAMEGFAGIPQEVRLLFRGLRKIESLDVEGLLQMSHRRLANGGNPRSSYWRSLSPARRYSRFSKVVISITKRSEKKILDFAADWTMRKVLSIGLTIAQTFGAGKIKPTYFESVSFEDFTWRTLFSKTLPASDFDLVSGANHRINSVPWRLMHMVGLGTLSWRRSALYPKMDTSDFDVFIGQTPYPARIDRRTVFVIRYHDAIPVFMPHTIPEKSVHHATHFHALMSNVRSGAWFACVSEATRQDLLKLFPEAAARSIVIYNMVSHHYYPTDSDRDLVPGIIRSRYYGFDPDVKGLAPKFLTLREQESFFVKNVPSSDQKYLLIVSTIEPRKNHLRLLAAWEVLKAEVDKDIKLVVVGTLGWDNAPILKAFRSWIDRGDLFMLNAVPAPDLRVLYRHAAATVCPSLSEGFDFSGVESMACGGITVASDIPVHREVYGDAAEYFDLYSTGSLVGALKKVLYSDDAENLQARMRERGAAMVTRYQPEAIIPQWEDFLGRITSSGG